MHPGHCNSPQRCTRAQEWALVRWVHPHTGPQHTAQQHMGRQALPKHSTVQALLHTARAPHHFLVPPFHTRTHARALFLFYSPPPVTLFLVGHGNISCERLLPTYKPPFFSPVLSAQTARQWGDSLPAH
jgi:hypothetical protein